MELMTVLIPTLLAIGYWAIGVIQSRRSDPKEPFSVEKTITTVGTGIVVGLLQGLAGMAVDPATITTWSAFDSLVIVAASKIIGPKTSTVPPASSTEPAAVVPVASHVIPDGGEPPFPGGRVQVLGIYGGSANSNLPKPSHTCDVNQVPEMYFDTLTIVTGTVMMRIGIDDSELKDWGMMGADLKTIGQKLPWAFWIPQQYRVPGQHVVRIITGYVTAQGVVWTDTHEYPLTFTGTKRQD